MKEKKNLEDTYYKTGFETSWNMRDGYYEELQEYKKMFRIFFSMKASENLLLTLKGEFAFTFPYICEYKQEVSTVKELFSEVEKLLYRKHAGGRLGEEQGHKEESACLNMLWSTATLLNVLQARKGMLQRKIEDPEVTRRKYGG